VERREERGCLKRKKKKKDRNLSSFNLGEPGAINNRHERDADGKLNMFEFGNWHLRYLRVSLQGEEKFSIHLNRGKQNCAFFETRKNLRDDAEMLGGTK